MRDKLKKKLQKLQNSEFLVCSTYEHYLLIIYNMQSHKLYHSHNSWKKCCQSILWSLVCSTWHTRTWRETFKN